ncbi:XrtN system VIT domain-containing protein [Pontibacter sp. BT731]|uniref:XrtN system VIT domain-containing protein n=1 Tax=Pontibacter coccineus TaxID=3063328 RepID=UPI0026E2259B|nr:XrtN system VIT domain-containing protein [Pontibacter sp. BT731]MDO6390124.1 XrtN system VIT domain-containing protein [Pontibacter sp. BT731]
MNTKLITRKRTQNELSLLQVGTGLTLFSFLIFLLPEWGIAARDGAAFAIFWVNYGLAILYFVLLLLDGRYSLKKPFQELEHLYPLLVLAIISCYSLNRQMSIFQDSVPWLEALVCMFCIALIAYSYHSLLPRLANQVLLFLLGIGAVLWVYYALYLFPLYAPSFLLSFVLGLSLHTFVPLWVVLCLAFAVKKAIAADQQYGRSFLAGAAFPVVFAAFFLVQWHQRNQQINFLANEEVIKENDTLPRWVSLSQQLPADYITERIMKTDLVYQAPAEEFSMWELPEGSFSEIKRHDPLVILSLFLLGRPNVDRQEKIKILESMYNARHQAEQRLWSGNNLSTVSVVSQVRIHPAHRLAYTEKVLSIHNSMPNSWNQQEAIYTFFLPEGSVVSSLSLWIEGREEKGYLTTKGKAQTAYNTIVGRERRDPSVIHWQEGNRVSVRVFPCTPDENRQFKIGVTSPLRQDGQELVYDNVYFTGPSAAGATETSMVYVEGEALPLHLPAGYKETKLGAYKRQSSYQQDWSLRLPVTKLASDSFTFGGSSYQLQELPQQLEAFTPTQVYLDINASWSARELDQVWDLIKDRQVYVWQDRMRKLTTANKAQVFSHLTQQQYSLFPLHKIKDTEQALVISKSSGNSPNLSDLKNTGFAEEMTEKLPLQGPIRVYTLGEQLSPYLRGLKELRVIAAMQGDVEQMAGLLQQQQFIRVTPEKDVVRLGTSGIGIAKAASGTGGSAPDHLLRLFAYNHILQQIGPRYFCQGDIEDELIQEAAQANIVSPVSSLIVLETQADYERFDIQKSKDSLGNASMNASGAVPEPEEWALIIIALLAVAFVTLKPYFLR